MKRSSKQAGPFPPRAAGQDPTGHQGPATAVALCQEGGLAVAELWEQDFTELPWAALQQGGVGEGFDGV